MKFRSLRYYILEAVRGLIKNRLMTVAAVVTLASCIFMLVVTYSLAANLDYILKQMESGIGIYVYILDEVDADGVNDMYNEIYAMEHVVSIKYVSKDEALAIAREEWEDSEGLLAGLDGADNPLPRTFEIELDDIRNQAKLIASLEDMQSAGIEKIRHSQKVSDMLVAVNNVLRVISILVVLGLAVISVVIIMNTIKLAVNGRKTEINIMKYVGATDWFIRWPFIIEGLLIGILGAVLPVFICWVSYQKAIDTLVSKLPMIQDLFEFRTAMAIFPPLLPISILLGILIGIAGSVTSIRKHLKV